MGIRIVPYFENDGCWTWRDSEVCGMFDRMAAEGMAEVVFFDGPMDRAGFLRMMKHGPCSLFVVMVDAQEAGFAWLSQVEGRSAWVNFYVFKAFWGRGAADIGRACLRYLLHIPADAGGYCFDVLLGITPVRNRAASEYLVRTGCRVVGRVPNAVWVASEGQSEPGLMVYCTREELEAEDEGL